MEIGRERLGRVEGEKKSRSILWSGNWKAKGKRQRFLRKTKREVRATPTNMRVEGSGITRASS